MFSRSRWFSCLFCTCSLVTWILLAIPALLGQAKAPADDPNYRLNPTREFSRDDERRFRALVITPPEGDVDPKTADLIDAAAQYYAYRTTWLELQNAPNGMVRVVNEADSAIQDFINRAKAGAKNDKVRRVFNERMTARLEDVMANPRMIARINAARILALLAETKYEEVADALVKLINDDKQNDGVKYWAFFGLRELLKPETVLEPIMYKSKEREAAVAQALVKAIERKGPMTGSREEIEGARVLRREAIRALALFRTPVLVEPKEKKIVAMPALALMRIIGQPDGFTPEPRLDEQVEAAVGLARMRSRSNADYNPDYAAEQIGYAVVRLAERAQDKSLKERESWRIHAARLLEALEMMKLDAGKNPKVSAAAPYVADVVARTTPILQAIEKGQTTNAGNLNSWLKEKPSTNRMLVKNVKESAIKTAP